MKQDLKKVTISGFTICTIKRKEENYLVLKRKTSHNERNLLLADGGGCGGSSSSCASFSSSRITTSIVLKCLVFFWFSTHRLPREELSRHRLSIGFVIGLNSISRDYKSRFNLSLNLNLLKINSLALIYIWKKVLYFVGFICFYYFNYE